MQEVKIKRNPKLRDDTDLRQTMLDKIILEKEDLVTINELLLAIRRLQKVSHDTKLQTIVQVLDQDKDGCIDINTALKVIELLGRENVKISPQQMADITKLLEAEQKVEEDIQKTKQEKRAAEELQELKEKSSSSPDKP
ncbi:hypothetical protein NP493_1533g00004 [Ridgeia piscesae]|uniref:EF-hand domain-containing protein n=1 Tax=Ridgeia piscesae TaxID=27915 RepID=A0AAD9N9M8_RIDPI|nr:hypothetical protein NP493_1533g00004 [Ridgeia piscesae]